MKKVLLILKCEKLPTDKRRSGMKKVLLILKCEKFPTLFKLCFKSVATTLNCELMLDFIVGITKANDLAIVLP